MQLRGREEDEADAEAGRMRSHGLAVQPRGEFGQARVQKRRGQQKHGAHEAQGAVQRRGRRGCAAGQQDVAVSAVLGHGQRRRSWPKSASVPKQLEVGARS